MNQYKFKKKLREQGKIKMTPGEALKILQQNKVSIVTLLIDNAKEIESMLRDVEDDDTYIAAVIYFWENYIKGSLSSWVTGRSWGSDEIVFTKTPKKNYDYMVLVPNSQGFAIFFHNVNNIQKYVDFDF